MADIIFEDIQPFVEGQGDTGKTAREKINRNFQKLKGFDDAVRDIRVLKTECLGKTSQFGHDYFKEFAIGEVPTSTAKIESFGFGGKTGDVLQVLVDAQGYESGQKFLVIYGKETVNGAWVALIGASYYSSVSRRKTLESDYTELGFLLGPSVTSAEVKASLLDERPALSDMLSKVDGYYLCTSDSNVNKTIKSEFFRLRNGGTVIIYFTLPNTKIAPVTLNINGTGDKELYLNGEPVGVNNTWQKGSVCLCWYDEVEQRYNIKVLFDVYGDSLTYSFSVIKDICLDLLNWNSIAESTQFSLGKYVIYQNTTTSLGLLASSTSYYYSSPISLTKGDIIKVRSYGNQYCPIHESDENGNILTRLVPETNSTSVYKNYTYIATKDMYVVVNVQNSTTYPYSVSKAVGMPTLLNLLEKSSYLFNGSTKKTGDTLFTSSQASPGDTLFYRIRTASAAWTIRLYYLEEGTQKFVNYVYKNPCVPNQDYYGKFTIPSDIDFVKATTGWSSVNASIAKDGTMGAESIALIMMQDELAEVQSSLNNHSNLPSYYDEYLDEKETEIRNIQLGIEGNEDSFIFITDTHWIDNYKQSPAIIESLLKRGLTNKVVFGGDLMGLHSDVNKETRDETKEYIKTQIDFHRKFTATVLSCGAKFFNIRGNHDINGYPATKTTQQGDDTIEMWRAPENATQNILSQTLESMYGIKNLDGINYVYDNDLNKIRFVIFDGNETSYRKKYDSEDEPMPYGTSIVEFAKIPWVAFGITAIKAKFDIEIPSGYTEGNVAVKIYLGTKEAGQSEPTWDLNSERRITSISGEQVLEFSRSDMNKYIGICFGENFNNARIRLTFAQNGSGEYLANTLNWLATALTGTPADYDVVVLSHYAATVATGSTFIPDFNRMLLAYNAKANTNINNNQYDFSNVQGKVLAYISGHTHKNLQSFSAGVTHICTACDAKYSENPYMNEKPYSRGQETKTEQLFDFIQIDKAANMICCKRIGAGYDRYFHTQQNSVRNGNSITLETTMLSDDLTWGCYDNDAWVTKTDKTQITSSRVTVSNGVVSAIAIGEAVVYAIDTTGNREFFEVIVN